MELLRAVQNLREDLPAVAPRRIRVHRLELLNNGGTLIGGTDGLKQEFGHPFRTLKQARNEILFRAFCVPGEP